jgi:hypothetical protein
MEKISIPCQNACHMGASAGRRRLFPSWNWTFGVAIDLLLLDLDIRNSILRDCHYHLGVDRSVQARQLVSRDLPMREKGGKCGGAMR